MPYRSGLARFTESAPWPKRPATMPIMRVMILTRPIRAAPMITTTLMTMTIMPGIIMAITTGMGTGMFTSLPAMA